MEELIKQTRVRISEPRQAESKKFREKKPPQQTGSSNEDNKVQKWFRRQFSGRMGEDYEAREMEFAAATAAAAFSIHSHEEAEARYQKNLREEFKASRTKIKTTNYQETRTDQHPKSGRAFSGKDEKFDRRAESSLRNSMAREDRRAPLFPIGKADAWEKSELEKILKRYEKMKYAILAWENEKKMKVKLRMERRKAELEHRRTLNQQHYENKIERIDNIAGGARAQLEQKRRKEESKLKEKAKKIRTKGRVPVKTCFCF